MEKFYCNDLYDKFLFATKQEGSVYSFKTLKKLLLCLMLFFITTPIFAQDAFTATWPLTADIVASKSGAGAADVTANDLLIGAGYASNVFSSGGLGIREASSAPFWAGRNFNVNAGFSGPGTVTNQYLEFSIKAGTGKDLKINQINIPLSRSGNGASLVYNIAYSLDGFATAPVFIEGTLSTPTPTAATITSFNYTNEIVVPEGKTLAVRFIIWRKNTGAVNTSNTITLGSNVTISGTSNPAVPVANFTWIDALVKYQGAADFTIQAPVSQNTSPFVYSSSEAAVATVSNNVISVHGAGTINITVQQAADGTYQAVSRTIVLTVYGVPLIQSATLTASETSAGALDIRWTKPNPDNGYGANTIVVLYREGATVTPPVNGTTYTTQPSSDTFAASATGTIGSGANTGYVISQTGTRPGSRPLTNVPAGTYDIYIYEFNGFNSNGGEAYLTTNPLKVTVTSTLAPLPVNLVSFSGKVTNSGVSLNWVTASEQNTEKFELERKVGAAEFVKIGEKKAAGDSKTTLSYNYIDNQFVNNGNVNYYRLKMIDNDGTFKYSNIEAVKTALSELVVNAFPNPASNVLKVEILQKDLGNTDIALANLAGSVVRKVTVTTSVNEIKVADLAKGIYVLSVIKNGKTMSTKKVILN
ncbi:MAG: T9SS type A sorting domain-containing protein [Pedobacter sp.]|uniref:T9SS type A sorting domain-containing protein n=1 Tax=Pedobacter sp. TaxID=1411316 RepID=UPI002809D87C|nr:T9SS type A sorting domain-containing protein [Pedobacter sp.]MDQ8005877.1 T9SS type A sorting domain-containing protein [Pedobacter sp.]